MKRTQALVALLTTAALGLAACEEGEARRNRAAAGGGVDGICKPFTNASANQAAPGMAGPMLMDGAVAVEDCVHRWAYTLAGAEEDSADVVAQAVVAACMAPLSRWNQQSLAAEAAGDSRMREAPSLLTGEPTNPIAEHNNFAEGRALFYVVQARAGDCKPPRVDRDDDDDRNAQGGAATTSGYAPNSPDR